MSEGLIAKGEPIAPALKEALLALGSATLYEASGLECYLPARLRPVWQGAQVVGRALPVSVPAGDNLGLHLALEVANPDDVLVVDAGNASFGYWGEVLTVAAQASGVRGLIIDGGVRDTRELEGLGFPVFSSHIALRGTAKDSAGNVGTPVQLDSITVSRGDIIVADADGIVAFPADMINAVLTASIARQSKEEAFIGQLRDGASTMQLYGFGRPSQH